jgi:GTP diphosphokinase / guanosine-3',5'-bis(diphosphate) 3'-diphosphatase
LKCCAAYPPDHFLVGSRLNPGLHSIPSSNSPAPSTPVPPAAANKETQGTNDSGFVVAADERSIVTLTSVIKLAQTYLGDEDIKRIREAYRFSDFAHLGQTRKSGEPYISHPTAVAETCAQWKLDTESLMAALLHDVMEDSDTTKQELKEKFGVQVAELVDGLSKLDKLEYASREVAQAESFRKMLLAMARDVRVMLIKLADRLHNMRTLDVMEPAKAKRIANETLEIYAPIASRLGLYKLYRELQDLAFKAQYPFRFATLQKALRAARGNRREVLGKIQDEITKRLQQANLAVDIYGREKTLFGVYRKMREKRRSFSEVLDIYAFRVVVEKPEQCYLALGVIHGTFKPIPGRFKDFIGLPKVNGYQSLHTAVVGPFGTPVEFQIRTREMQRTAEQGIAAHWLYKAEKESFTDLQKRTHQWLQSLLEIGQQTSDSLEFIENVKVDLFPDAVYVFTPKGQIRALPRGATIIDYAYSVHTEVGDTTIAARLNGQSVALRQELRSGDVVEVITDSNSHPNPMWLSFVRTGKARAEIRLSLRKQSSNESIELGKRLLEQALAAMRIDAASLDPTVIERGARDAGAKSVDELYQDIGLGKRLAPVAARSLALQFSGKPATAAAAMLLPRLAPIFIHGNEGSAVSYGNCCHPLPGDHIIGHLRGGHGLIVHRHDCATAVQQQNKDAERWVDVHWSDDVNGQFRTDIELLVSESRGALARVAAQLAAADANIVHVQMEDNPAQTASMRFSIQVKDRVHLAQVMREVRKLPDVQRIVRK